MSSYPKCPWCGAELVDAGLSDENVLKCEACDQLFYSPDGEEVCVYEPYPDDDMELADICRGGDLFDD